MRQPSVVTIDLDSTLCDTRHRQHLLPSIEERANYDWRIYSMQCANDVPILGTVRTAQLLSAHHAIIAITGRAEEAKSLTVEWFCKHLPFEVADVLMAGGQGRWDATGLTHGQYKVGRIQELQALGHDVVLHIDDYEEVAEATAEIGVPTLLVRPPGSTGDILR